MSIGTSKQITVAGGKRAMVLFDGTQGERVSLQVDPQTTTADSVFSILGPHRYLVPGNIDQPPHVQGSSVLFGPLTLPNTGTYTILIESQSGSPLTDDLTLTGVAPDVSGKIAIGGPPVTVTTTTPGQNAALKFKGTGGRRFSLKTSNSNLTGTVEMSMAAPRR